jgi:hypothetical protein
MVNSIDHAYLVEQVWFPRRLPDWTTRRHRQWIGGRRRIGLLLDLGPRQQADPSTRDLAQHNVQCAKAKNPTHALRPAWPVTFFLSFHEFPRSFVVSFGKRSGAKPRLERSPITQVLNFTKEKNQALACMRP